MGVIYIGHEFIRGTGLHSCRNWLSTPGVHRAGRQPGKSTVGWKHGGEKKEENFRSSHCLESLSSAEARDLFFFFFFAR